MAFTRKSSPSQTSGPLITGVIPKPPNISEEMTRRFPDLAEYDKAMQDWWGIFSGMLQRDRDEIKGQFDAISAEIAALKAP